MDVLEIVPVQQLFGKHPDLSIAGGFFWLFFFFFFCFFFFFFFKINLINKPG